MKRVQVRQLQFPRIRRAKPARQLLFDLTRSCPPNAQGAMRVLRLFTLAGIVLPVLAGKRLAITERHSERPSTTSLPVEHETISKRTDITAADRSPTPRRLQLHLTDASAEQSIVRSDLAYAALLIDDQDRGIRTLGQSLIDSRTGADLVAILGPAVTLEAELRMRAQGWRIRRLVADGVGRDDALDLYSGSGSVRGDILIYYSYRLFCCFRQARALFNYMIINRTSCFVQRPALLLRLTTERNSNKVRVSSGRLTLLRVS